jgi:peptide-methionine (S)-S-oxide reductase
MTVLMLWFVERVFVVMVGSDTVYFGAGCFWGVEAAFRQLPGIISTAVGYQGGTKLNPSYEDVCTGATGHAEVVAATFDPEKLSYEDLLDLFWKTHDPTTLNRQGADVGTQYRSVIFFRTDAQQVAAEKSKQLHIDTKTFSRSIVTDIQQAGDFFIAEEYHQQYLEKRGISSGHIRESLFSNLRKAFLKKRFKQPSP